MALRRRTSYLEYGEGDSGMTMASTKSAMTPEAAAAAIAEVGEYRQGLTARAAAIVWMVWGLTMAGVAMLDIVVAPTVQVDPSLLNEGWNVQEHGYVYLVLPLTFLIGGVLATNAIWRAHAIERATRHRGWVAWAALAGLIALVVAVGLTAVYVAIRFTNPGTADRPAFGLTYVFITPVFSGGAALLLSLLQRRRVRPLPGLIGTAVLLAWMFLATLLEGSLATKVANAGIVHAVLCVVVFCGVGLWHFNRG